MILLAVCLVLIATILAGYVKTIFGGTGILVNVAVQGNLADVTKQSRRGILISNSPHGAKREGKMELLNKLEEIKQLGSYAVDFMFGEDIGCDDSDVPKLERRARILFHPVGCLGEVRIMFIGKVKDLLEFDFKTKPKQISNPPKREEFEKNGYYIWGTERSVETILEKPFFGQWND